MTITFKICNVTCDLVKTVMLRKFFQMVFVGNDRKSLNVYTATVLGGSGPEKSKSSPDKVKSQYISNLDEYKEFCMKFGFIVSGNDDNEVRYIKSENVTEQEGDFLSQEKCIRQVWGEQCRIIHNNYSELKRSYCKFRGIEEKDLGDKEQRDLASMASIKILWIQDDGKMQEPEMCAISVPGRFSPENYEYLKEQERETERGFPLNDGNEKAFYLINVPTEFQISKGIELLNWVKTTIRFKYVLTDPNMNFCIKKDLADNTEFIAPDFTWYFSPPVKSFINYESSSAEVRWQKRGAADKECLLREECKCPIKPEEKPKFTSKRYDNIINPVANKTTVNFRRWIKDEMIGCRQKYRIIAKNIFSQPDTFKDVKELNIYIDSTDEHSRGNRQYILGIFISFALAFGIDKTRLGDAQKYFPFIQLLLADTWWLFMIISVTLNLLILPVKGTKIRWYAVWRKVNIIASLIWIFIVFCLDKSKLLTDYFYTYVGQPLANWFEQWFLLDLNYYWFPQALFIILLLSNDIYAFVNIKKYHDPILSNFFSGDIL